MSCVNVKVPIKLAFVGIILFVIFGLSHSAIAVENVRICCQMPKKHFVSEAVEQFIEKAEELSNGSLKFQYYPAAQLYSAEELPDILPKGGVEMAQIGLDRHSGRVPVGHFAYPYFADTNEYYRWWYDKEGGGGIFYNILQPGFAKDNIKLLSTLTYAPDYATITKEPIDKLSDYEGLKIRASGKTFGAIIEELGGKPVVMSSSDVYTSLQRGVIDGALSGTSSFVSRKWYEMADYVSLINLGHVPFGFAANLDWWNSLNDEQRNAIEEATREMEIWAVDEAIKEHKESIDIMENAGLEDISRLSQEDEGALMQIGLDAVRDVAEEDVGKETWDKAMDALKNAREGNKTWEEILENRKF